MTATLFQTQIMLITFVIIIIQILTLPISIVSIAILPKNKSRLRYLILTLGFLSFNFFGSYFPDSSLNLSMLIQNIFIYSSGIFMAGYFFVFISKEFNFSFNLMFNVKILFFGLIMSFIVGYGLLYSITKDLQIAYYVFISGAILISIYFCFHSIKSFLSQAEDIKLNPSKKRAYYCCLIGIILIALLPIASILSGQQLVEVLLVNTAYFLVSFSFLSDFIKAHQVNTNTKNLKHLRKTLSSKEYEVALLMLDGLDFPINFR